MIPRSALNEINLDTNAIDLLAALYDGHKDSFVQHLNVIGIVVLVDVSFYIRFSLVDDFNLPKAN